MMAIATMSSYAHTSSSAADMAPIGVFMPDTPLVVRREKRRRRRQDDVAIANKTNKKTNDSNKKRRHGFVFDAPTHEEPAVEISSSRQAAASSTFVFRVRKDAKPTTNDAKTNASAHGGVDASNATAALLKKKERELKRVRLQQRKAAMEQEEQLEAVLMETHKLSRDQLQLYYAVRDQVKREMRKTMRDFARSAARADILQLTEKSLQAVKDGIVEFMAENPPSRTVETVANPENERLHALIESYEARVKELEGEENDWIKMKESIKESSDASEQTAITEGESKESETSEACELSVTRGIEGLQRKAIEQVVSSAVRVIHDSMASIDRLALQAEIKKSQLFDAFHRSAFQGYEQNPKDILRTMLRLK